MDEPAVIPTEEPNETDELDEIDQFFLIMLELEDVNEHILMTEN